MQLQSAHLAVRRSPSKSDGNPALCLEAKRMFGRIDSSALLLHVFGLPLEDVGVDDAGDAPDAPNVVEHEDDNVPETVAECCFAAAAVGDLRLAGGSSCRSGHATPLGQYPLVNGSQSSAVALTLTWRYLHPSRAHAPRRNILQSGTLFCELNKKHTHITTSYAHRQESASQIIASLIAGARRNSQRERERAKQTAAGFSTLSFWCDSRHLGSLHSFFRNFRHIATRRLS